MAHPESAPVSGSLRVGSFVFLSALTCLSLLLSRCQHLLVGHINIGDGCLLKQLINRFFFENGRFDLGFHLLDQRFELVAAPEQRTEVQVDHTIYDDYVGRYQLAMNVIITVTE